MWEDGTTAEDYVNFEPNYGKAFSGAGDAKVSVNKMQQYWKLEKGSEERSFACQCPSPGQDRFTDSSENDYDYYNPEEMEPVYQVFNLWGSCQSIGPILISSNKACSVERTRTVVRALA